MRKGGSIASAVPLFLEDRERSASAGCCLRPGAIIFPADFFTTDQGGEGKRGDTMCLLYAKVGPSLPGASSCMHRGKCVPLSRQLSGAHLPPSSPLPTTTKEETQKEGEEEEAGGRKQQA